VRLGRNWLVICPGVVAILMRLIDAEACICIFKGEILLKLLVELTVQKFFKYFVMQRLGRVKRNVN